jgi:hypothetical protein
MKTFFADIFPKIQRFSERLDNLTLLTNQHWVVFDDIENAKNVYIFRPNNELLISTDGKVEKAKWEYLGQNSLLIDLKNESFLFKHGFFDENILALKLDSKEEYAILVNETKYIGELNTLNSITSFLYSKYLGTNSQSIVEKSLGVNFDESLPLISKTKLTKYETPKGIIFLEGYGGYPVGKKAYINEHLEPARDGKYQIGVLWYIRVKSGVVTSSSLI